MIRSGGSGSSGGMRGALLASAILLLPGAPVAAVDPLVLRVGDAIGAPGAQTAIILRTYAPRPVRRGRASTVTTPGGGVAPLGSTTPIASFDGGLIFSREGDVIGSFDFDPLTQTIVADFDSGSATINRDDGIFGVLYVTLEAGLAPGSSYAVTIDGLQSFLTDVEDDPIELQPREGTLQIRSPATPLAVEVDGGRVQPGSGATIEIGTSEPFALEQGRVVMTYDPAIAAGLPTVTSDPRHGVANLTVTYPAANKLQIDFVSPDDSFNVVPGDLLVVHLPIRPDAPLGGSSPLAFDSAASWLDGPGATPLAISWAPGAIAFELDPDIFRNGFETGDPWVWSDVFP